MRFLIAALVTALIVGAAQAQMGNPVGSQIGGHAAHAEQKTRKSKTSKADEKAYNSALRTLPDKQFDPWHGVR